MALPTRQQMIAWEDFLNNWRDAAEDAGFTVEALLNKEGLPILACSKKSKISPDQPTIYLSSGIHGDEPSGPQALLGLMKEGFFHDRFHWLICPALNPTGLAANTRENAEGIDLNRDYHHCKTTEVCAHIKWLEQQKCPQLFLSLHEDWESTGFYYYEINTGGASPNHQDILSAATLFFPPEPALIIDDHEVTKPGWIFHPASPDIPTGWPEAIYLSRLGCPLSLTFETPSSMILAKRIACHQAVVKKACEQFEAE